MIADGLIAGRYRLQSRVGVGGMGEVWQAFDERLSRVVAVKPLVLAPGLSDEQADQARRRAIREGRIAARLQHPGAVTVYDVAEDDGRPVLVMEYVPGRSLAEIIAERGTVPAAEVAAIGAQVAAALAAAHAAGIVHRDVKPANILITDDGAAKITDFGIARALGDVTVTANGILVGTPAFLAPEVARGREPDPTGDVFSLGATLYTALEGRPPFGDGDNAIAVLQTVAAGQFAPSVNGGALGEVVAQLMRVDPAERPTMADAAERLRAVAAGHSPPAPTRVDLRPLPDAPVGPRSRRGGPAVLIAVIAVVGLALLTLVVANRPGEPDQATTVPSASSPPTTAAVTAEDLRRAVAEYYALLPEHTDQAWTRLGPTLRAAGQEQYEKAWKDVKDLTIFSAPRATGADTVTVGLEYTQESRGRLREVHRLVLIVRDGVLLIDADHVQSSERVKEGGPKSEKKKEDKEDKEDDDDGG
ncbi:serine/threonine-protein kinase [Actinokineospora alba]|uniref:serine/threonine-protein kinase n=1 Tax=Actinokineospora alba TaxID=504798 RepID=UPI000ADA6591